MNALTRNGVMALGLLGSIALADDTELFVTESNAPFTCPAPNVLFVIDTSGSMDGEVLTQQPWDPAIEFDGCYESDAVYFSSTATIPDCSSEDYILKSNMFCDAFQGTEFTGVFQAWDDNQEQWRPLNQSEEDWPLECSADEGLHGDGTGGEVYAVDGTDGPWSGDEANRVAWGGNASAATLFDGNRLNWETNPPQVSSTRMEIVQEVTTTALDSMTNVKVGLMRFNDVAGGPVIQAIDDLATTSDELKTKINALPTDGFTPLAETLFEAHQYLSGGPVIFGDVESDNRSVAESRTGGTLTSTGYDSPLDETGQTTYIVLLTDGEPSEDTDADAAIEQLPEFASLVGTSCDGNGDGACLDDLAEYLNKRDLRPDIPGLQNVITHTIGFNVDLELLDSTATRGGGRYFVADNTSSLTQVLADLAQDFNNTVSLLASPGIPIDSFNRTENVDAAYLSLFQPSNTYRWQGNVKRYRLDAAFDAESGTTTVRLVDALGNEAIDPDTGLFRNSAVSLWSQPTVDGGRVDIGGAASQLPDFTERKLYTDINGGNLTAPNNRITDSNTDLTAALLGAPEEERNLVIGWALGADVRDEDDDPATTNRFSMGDPLHVQPITVDYGDAQNDSDIVVFATTNDGYLHALRADTGEELWAYVPGRLLDRLYALSLDEETPSKQYGLDGAIRFVESGGRKILIFGMRRGGDSLFALDVTSKLAPTKLWEINDSSSGFDALGQTWPAPVFGRFRGTPAAVLSGGYDPGQDNRTFRQDQSGNAVYIVDLLTGEKLWSAGINGGDHDVELAAMQFSIPATAAVRDFSGNGDIDHIYVADMGGQVLRFDLATGSDDSAGGVVASLGGAAIGSGVSNADARRLYNTPDVVLVANDERLIVRINVGSGYRAHPLDTDTNDEFFSIRDPLGTGFAASAAYGPPITRDDLLDITNNVEPTLEFNAPGWRLSMIQGPGEKILGESLTVANTVIFNSFTPTQTSNSCLPVGGINRLYAIDILDAAPLTNLDNSPDSTTLTTSDRFLELSQGGIAAPPELVFLRSSQNPDPNDLEGSILSGTQLISLDDLIDDDGANSSRFECGDQPGCPRRSFWFPGPPPP